MADLYVRRLYKSASLKAEGIIRFYYLHGPPYGLIDASEENPPNLQTNKVFSLGVVILDSSMGLLFSFYRNNSLIAHRSHAMSLPRSQSDPKKSNPKPKNSTQPKKPNRT